MNVIFLYSIYDAKTPAKPLRTPEEMQFGISYISSLLKRHNHLTKLVILSRMFGKKNKMIIDENIKMFSPGLICFTAVSSEYPFIANIAGYIKNKHPHIYLLAGGPHISLNPDAALKDSFDALCIGEGEYPTLEIVLQLQAGISPSNIPNLWIKRDAGVEKNMPRPFLEDLDSLPFPDRNMWDELIEEDDDNGNDVSYPILLARGCPFECTYCCNHAFKKIASGRYVRLRKVDSIFEEIHGFVDSYPAKRNIYLEIETIGIDKQWVLDLCLKLRDFNSILDKPLSFGVNLRIAPNIDYGNLFSAFRYANFKFVNIGVESGSEKIRREILNRNYANEDIVNVVYLARQYGLRINFYNLIGIPGETLNDFKETVNINRVCLPDNTLTHVFYPYPGTQLYSLCKKQGLLNKTPDTKLERCRAVLDLPAFRRRQIQKSFILFDYYVYKGHRSIFKIFAKVLVAILMSNSYLHYFYRALTQISFLKYGKYLLKKIIFKEGKV